MKEIADRLQRASWDIFETLTKRPDMRLKWHDNPYLVSTFEISFALKHYMKACEDNKDIFHITLNTSDDVDAVLFHVQSVLKTFECTLIGKVRTTPLITEYAFQRLLM